MPQLFSGRIVLISLENGSLFVAAATKEKQDKYDPQAAVVIAAGFSTKHTHYRTPPKISGFATQYILCGILLSVNYR